jgi:hypothetical protein
LGAFELLTFHPHQKTPISPEAFGYIRRSLPSLFADEDGEFRVEVTRSLRNLFLRVRSSSHAAAKELERRKSKLNNVDGEFDTILQTASSFIEWLVSFCRDCLTPGRTYYASSMALKTLCLMCEEGLIEDIDVEVKPSVLSGVRVSLFSRPMLSVLIDRLADPFEEVARLVYWLIERIKAPEMIPWDSLFSSGMLLNLSGRADKADGGARILALCQRFEEFNGQSELWETIFNSLSLDLEEKDIRKISVRRPLHGRLIALRYSLSSQF